MRHSERRSRDNAEEMPWFYAASSVWAGSVATHHTGSQGGWGRQQTMPAPRESASAKAWAEAWRIVVSTAAPRIR